MTLKEVLDEQWNRPGCLCPFHIVRWSNSGGYTLKNDGGFALYYKRGRRINLKCDRAKRPLSKSEARYTPQGLIWYRGERAMFVEKVGKARKVLGLA